MKKRVHVFLSFFHISILSMHDFYMVAFAAENLTTLENQKSLYVVANVDGETSENSVYAKEERNIQDKTILIAEEKSCLSNIYLFLFHLQNLKIPNLFIKYEDIYQPFNGPYSIYTSTAPNSVTLAMFTPTTTGNYTITTESTADMYLYLVDPRTMKPRIHNDDDGGNSQPKISTKFVEGVPYMIIISRYAISESSVMIALKIVKN